MSILFGIAKKNGYEKEVEFETHFLSPHKNKQTDNKHLETLSSFLSAEDLQLAMNYARDAA